MKILYVHGSDYAALDFESEYAGVRVDSLIKELLSGKKLTTADGEVIPHTLVDVPDIVISREFRDFVRTELRTYDEAKASNFYLPNERI